MDNTSYYKNEGDNTFIVSINPEWSRTLPAAFVFDKTDNKLEFWIGKKSLEKLETIINSHLNTKKKLESDK